MKDFIIRFPTGVLKVLFKEDVEESLIRYTGRAYELDNDTIRETEKDFIFSFSFSRIARNSKTIIDFTLDTKFDRIREMKDSFEDLIITGIQGYDKGEKLDYVSE